MQHDDEIMEDNSPETQKAKLKVLQQEFAAEMKKKTEKIKPRLIGCIWMNGDEDEDGGSMVGNLEKTYHCSDIIWRILKAREMMSSGEPIKLEDFEPKLIESEEDNHHNEKQSKQKTSAANKVRPKIEGDSVKELIKLLHGNTNSKKFLIKEYQAYRLKNYHMLPNFQEFQIKSLEEKILEVSVYKTFPHEGPLFGKKCWYVKDEFIKEYFGDEILPIPNQWTYILEKEKKIKNNVTGESKKTSREVSPNSEPNQAKDNPTLKSSLKLVQESPKPSTSSKITSYVKNSPKTLSTVGSESEFNSPSQNNQGQGKSVGFRTPTQTKLAKEPQPKSPTVAVNKVINNRSPKVQGLSAQSSSSNGRKRVALLMSVKPGQSINVEHKNLLVNNFIKGNQNKETVEVSNVDDIIEIID